MKDDFPEKLQKILEVGLSISSGINLDKILLITIQSAVDILVAEGGGIILNDTAKGDLFIRAQVGYGNSTAELTKINISDLLFTQVIETNNTLRMSKKQLELSTGYLANSLLCVPLITTDKTIGAIFVYNKQATDSFSEKDELLLSYLANLTSNTIQNVKLIKAKDEHLDELEKTNLRRTNDLEIVTKIGNIISTKFEPSKLYKELVHQITVELNCTHCTLYFPKRINSNELLVPEVTWGKGKVISINRKFETDEGLIGKVYQSQISETFNDACNHPDYSQGKVNVDYHHRSMLISPILSSGETIGVITADQDKLNWFNKNDLKLVDTLGVLVGIGIERSLALVATKKISDELIGNLNPDQIDYILELVISTAVDLTKATTGIVYLIDESKKIITRSRSYPNNSFHPSPRRDNEGNFAGITKSVIRDRETLIIENADSDERVNPVLREKINSMAVLPLISQEDVVGILYLDDEDGHKYTQVELLILETLANQVGIALTSYSLIRRLEKSEEEYRELFGESVQARDGISSKLFYGEISHSVKNVLAQIAVNLDLISSSPSMRRLSNKLIDRLDQLESEVNNCIFSIQEFLDLAGESVSETTTSSVSSLVNHAIRLLEVKLKKNEINVDISELDDNISVTVNRSQLIMAFLNLIDNAIDALSLVNRSRNIKIFSRTSNNSPWVEIIFEDNGCGISKDNLNNLFKPFFSTKSKKGRGIGLLGSKRVIELHYGKLPKPWSQLGRGTKFTVYLPKK